MALFITEKDNRLINSLNVELINKIIDNPTVIYKISANNTDTNIYGEADNKIYLPGVKVWGLLTRGDTTDETTDAGYSSGQTVDFTYQREMLKLAMIYPDVGDIIEWNDAYYEITNTSENQLLMGRERLNHAIVCSTNMIRRTKLNIEKTDNI